jgi:sec-independent protein translocase protein TatA
MSPVFGIGFDLFQPTHLIFLLVIGILIFGKRLPETFRSLGKGLHEFKKGLRGLEDDVEGAVRQEPYQPPERTIEPPRPPQRVATNVPKFEDAGNVVPPQPQV